MQQKNCYFTMLHKYVIMQLSNANFCKTQVFRNEPCQMLKVIRHFSKHCSCRLQGECVLFGNFWKPYVGQAADSMQDITDLIGKAGCYQFVMITISANQICYVPLCCLIYIRLPKMPSKYIFILKIATAISAKILDNFQHPTQIIPESLNFMLNSSHRNLRTRTQIFVLQQLTVLAKLMYYCFLPLSK